MEKQLAQVFEFNKYGGQDVTHTPRMVSSQDFELQRNLLEEEIQELDTAFYQRDMVEVVDALVDIQYILLGMVCRFGLQHEFVRGFEEVNENNMTKIFDSEGKLIVKFREDGKILKPEGYQSVNLENVFPYLKTIR